MRASMFRTRVAVLWVGAAVAAAGSVLRYLVVPGALEEMLAGEMEGEPLDDAIGFFMASLIAIPLVMSALALLVQGRANRYLNLSVGSLFALTVVYAGGSHLSAGDFNAHVLMAALGGVLAFVIVGLSIGGLRRPGPQTTSARSERAAVSERIPV